MPVTGLDKCKAPKGRGVGGGVGGGEGGGEGVFQQGEREGKYDWGGSTYIGPFWPKKGRRGESVGGMRNRVN